MINAMNDMVDAHADGWRLLWCLARAGYISSFFFKRFTAEGFYISHELDGS